MNCIELIERCLQGKARAIDEFATTSLSVTELQKCLDHLQQITAMDARYSQALFLEGGIHFKINNYQHAIWCYEQAIALGNAWAMNDRAFMHRYGKGGPINNASAIPLYEQAIALGNATAMYNRARMYESGEGGPINDALAIAAL